MAISVELNDEEEQLLRQEAARRGVEASDYARQLIENQLSASNGEGAKKPRLSLAEMQALQAVAFEESGTTEEDLGDYVDDFVHRVVGSGERKPDGSVKYSNRPLVLTVNGKAEIVVQDAASYQKLVELVDRLEAAAAIKEGLDDVRNGRTRPAREALDELRQKHGIPC